MSTTSKTPSVPALERGLQILEVIAQSRSGLTFSQLARKLDFPKSSVHCLLLTFEREGYLHRSESTGRFVCGMKLVRIANMALDGIVLREKAAPLLNELMRRTGLTVHLAMLERNEAALVAKVGVLGGPTVPTWVGKRMDLHCTALGKCLIAWLPEAQVSELIKERGLLRHNENTIASLSKLKRELARTRQLGYSIDNEEEELGARCIGVPVFDADGQVAAAVSVSGSVNDIDLSRVDGLAALAKHTGLEISRRLGWFGDADRT